MQNKTYFIYKNNNHMGPFSLGEMVLLKIRGGIKPKDLISFDNIKWIRAEEDLSLFPSEVPLSLPIRPPPKTQHIPPIPVPKPRSIRSDLMLMALGLVILTSFFMPWWTCSLSNKKALEDWNRTNGMDIIQPNDNAFDVGTRSADLRKIKETMTKRKGQYDLFLGEFLSSSSFYNNYIPFIPVTLEKTGNILLYKNNLNTTWSIFGWSSFCGPLCIFAFIILLCFSIIGMAFPNFRNRTWIADFALLPVFVGFAVSSLVWIVNSPTRDIDDILQQGPSLGAFVALGGYGFLLFFLVFRSLSGLWNHYNPD